jgi:hypothetical protein
MLRANKDFVIAKVVSINAVPMLPQFDGDIPPKTARVVQIGEGVKPELMDTVVVYFPTAAHPYKDEDGSEYIMLRQSNILSYYDR